MVFRVGKIIFNVEGIWCWGEVIWNILDKKGIFCLCYDVFIKCFWYFLVIYRMYLDGLWLIIVKKKIIKIM